MMLDHDLFLHFASLADQLLPLRLLWLTAWCAPGLLIKDQQSWTDIVSALAVNYVFTVMSSQVPGGSLNLRTKTLYALAFAGPALAVHPVKERLAGYFFDAATYGIFCAWTSEANFVASKSIDVDTRCWTRLGLYVSHLLFWQIPPVVFGILGLHGLHRDYQLDDAHSWLSGIVLNLLTLVLHVLIREVLVEAFPKRFARVRSCDSFVPPTPFNPRYTVDDRSRIYTLSAIGHFLFGCGLIMFWEIVTNAPLLLLELYAAYDNRGELYLRAADSIAGTLDLLSCSVSRVFHGQTNGLVALWSEVLSRAGFVEITANSLYFGFQIMLWVWTAWAAYRTWCYFRWQKTEAELEEKSAP